MNRQEEGSESAAEQQQLEQRPQFVARLSRRKVLQGMGVAALGGVAARIAPPSSIAEAAMGQRLSMEEEAPDERRQHDCTCTVDTILDLRHLDSHTEHRMALVLGYYTPGDSGGGLFYWDVAAIEVDNMGTVIVTANNPPSGRWKRIWSGPIDVRWFGARGDGVTDDTMSSRAAQDTMTDAQQPPQPTASSVRYAPASAAAEAWR